MSDDIGISGGGSVAVDTPGMVRASAALEAARADLAALAAELGGCLADGGWHAVDDGPRVHARAALEDALLTCRGAALAVESAAAGLRTAALRYGATEARLADVVRGTAALVAGMGGTGLRFATEVFGPAAPAAALAGAAVLSLDLLGLAVAHSVLTTGRVEPQIDPAVLRGLRLALSSSDDLLRGFALSERPVDLAVDDPAAPYGTESIAAVAAGLLPVPSAELAVAMSAARPSARPRSLAGLADRVPDSKAGEPQIRIEAYPDGSGGRRWLVCVTGTVTFAPDPGLEPFDLRSDLLGIGDRPTDSTAAVLGAMRRAGIRPTDPLLLVGHSQGALDVTRIAASRKFAVAGVVTLGGPTGQIPLPAALPVLAVEHAEDPVPILGGLAASGSAGLARLVLRRRLYDRAPAPGSPLVPFSAGASPHAVPAYRQTLALADRAHDARIAAFERRIAPFLSGPPGTARLVRVDRRVRQRPGRLR